MSTTQSTAKDETVRKINRHIAKFVLIRIATGVSITVAGVMIANAIDRKLNTESSDQDNTENN